MRPFQSVRILSSRKGRTRWERAAKSFFLAASRRVWTFFSVRPSEWASPASSAVRCRMLLPLDRPPSSSGKLPSGSMFQAAMATRASAGASSERTSFAVHR